MYLRNESPPGADVASVRVPFDLQPFSVVYLSIRIPQALHYERAAWHDSLRTVYFSTKRLCQRPLFGLCALTATGRGIPHLGHCPLFVLCFLQSLAFLLCFFPLARLDGRVIQGRYNHDYGLDVSSWSRDRMLGANLQAQAPIASAARRVKTHRKPSTSLFASLLRRTVIS